MNNIDSGNESSIASFVIVRGGGDLASGIIHRLHCAGFRVLILEAVMPSAIRRNVAFSEAVYDGRMLLEGLTAVRIDEEMDSISIQKLMEIWNKNEIPLVIDPQGYMIENLKPQIVIDAIIAKRNLGTHKGMAPMTIGVGPGFSAGDDVDFVVETKRGHNLGRIIDNGSAVPNTGIPGNIGGYTIERVIHAQTEGILYNVRQIGDIVKKGEEIAYIKTADGQRMSVTASISGILRGLIRDEYPVTAGFKIADIDPREEELKNCFTISDKSRCIAGSVLELACRYYCGKN